MSKSEETLVTVVGTFAICKSRARNLVSYKTAIIYSKSGIRQNKENTLCEFFLEKTNRVFKECRSTTLFGTSSHGILFGNT